MKIGIYLGDIKKPKSVGDLTFELSFVDEILSQNTGHDYVFYYFGKKNIFKNTQNAKFVPLKYYKKLEISYHPFCIKAYKKPFQSLNYKLKQDKVNVVYFLSPYLYEHIETPYFANIRDVAHRILPHFPEFSTNRVVEKMERKLNTFLTAASKIITCTNVAKEDIKTLYDVIDENIVTLDMPFPNWVKNISPDENVLDKYDLLKNNYILYPAQFWTHKNHIRLVLVAQMLKEQNINLKVVFTGLDKGNKTYIQKQIKELDLEDDIVFLNYVNQQELAALYKNAYTLCYPCLAGPDSISALEAMYFSCPILISDNPGYIQQLKKSALYFNPLDEEDIFDKIRMLNDIATKDEILANGKNLIEQYTFKNYIDRFLKLMDDFYQTRLCWSLDENYTNK